MEHDGDGLTLDLSACFDRTQTGPTDACHRESLQDSPETRPNNTQGQGTTVATEREVATQGKQQEGETGGEQQCNFQQQIPPRGFPRLKVCAIPPVSPISF